MVKDFRSFLTNLLKFFILVLLVESVLGDCSEGQININSASLIELQKLNGIGPTYAQRIIDSRPFNSVDELIKVKGIGEKTLQKIKEQGLACVSSKSVDSNENNQNTINKGEQTTSNNEEKNSEEMISNQNVNNELSKKVNINTATISELKRIIGAGDKIAQEIINSRPFCSIDELLKVKGIGESSLQKIKEQNLAYVEENFCKEEIKEKSEGIVLNKKEENKFNEESEEKTTNEQKEKVINLGLDEKENKLITGKVVYESKTEKIRKYGIYFFSILLVIILFLLLRK